MEKRIVYKNQDGSVAVIVPAPNSGLTVDEVAARDVPDGVSFDIVNVSDLPQVRDFRNAWRLNGKRVQEDLGAAKEIAHGKRRAARDSEFAPLDVMATVPAEAARAEAERQLVRDKYASVQSDIDAARDIPALRNAIGGAF